MSLYHFFFYYNIKLQHIFIIKFIIIKKLNCFANVKKLLYYCVILFLSLGGKMYGNIPAFEPIIWNIGKVIKIISNSINNVVPST